VKPEDFKTEAQIKKGFSQSRLRRFWRIRVELNGKRGQTNRIFQKPNWSKQCPKGS